MATLNVYRKFDAWFDAVSDIDPVALDAPYRFTFGDDELARDGKTIGQLIAWKGAQTLGQVHYLEPDPTPEMEHSIVFEDILDAYKCRKVWGRYAVDTPTEEDFRKLNEAAERAKRAFRDD